MVRSLAQIRRARGGIQVRPQPLDRPVARKPVAIREGQQRHQLQRPARRPIRLRDLAGPDNDAETSQQLNAHLAGDGLHDIHSREHRHPDAVAQ